jgi:hypothetical protein
VVIIVDILVALRAQPQLVATVPVRAPQAALEHVELLVPQDHVVITVELLVVLDVSVKPVRQIVGLAVIV